MPSDTPERDTTPSLAQLLTRADTLLARANPGATHWDGCADMHPICMVKELRDALVRLADAAPAETPCPHCGRQPVLVGQACNKCGGVNGAPAGTRPSAAAIEAAARASGFASEDDPPDALLLRGVGEMLLAAYAVDGLNKP